MTEDLIIERIRQLQEEEKKAWAQLNAIIGAIEDCNYWLCQVQMKRKRKK